MKKLILISILSLFTIKKASSQDFTVFEHPLNSNKITLYQAIEKYVNSDEKDFKFIKIGKRLHSLVLKYDHKTFKNTSFVLIKDTINSNQFSLNQVGISSKEFHVNKENFKKLLNETNRIIKQFEDKHGEPTKSINNKERYFDENNAKITGDIIATTWVSNNVKLKITFSKEGGHGHYRYLLTISKFQDYLGNMKLPKWWNGY